MYIFFQLYSGTKNNALSLHIHVKRLFLVHEFYEIARETQCHALPLDPMSTLVFQ